MAASQYENAVFLNCPFDDAYRDLFEALVFAGGSSIATRFRHFQRDLPTLCAQLGLRPDELTFNNYVVQVEQWLKLNAHVMS